MIPIDPRFMNARSWAAQTGNILEPYGNIPVLVNDEDWKQWAADITLLPAIANLLPARPEGFLRWEDWANAFNETVLLLDI